jgi:hypothetical protein
MVRENCDVGALRWLLAFTLAVMAGCSSNSSNPTTTPAAAVDPTTEELDLDEGTFTVPAGQEVVYCVRIPMPAAFQGRDLALTAWDSDISVPAHHYFMFYDATTPVAGTAPVPCEGSNPLVPASSAGFDLFSMGTLMLVAGTGHDSFTSTPGYGMVLPANGSFVTNHHVINAGSAPVTVHATFQLRVKNATEVAHPTRALSCQTTQISIPPGGPSQVTATCTAPFDLDIVTMSSHAHQDLTTFEQRFYDGQATQAPVLYSSTQWDSPLVQQMATPLHLLAGQGITFTCHYLNQTGATIGFGLTATTEMCAAMNQYAYPVDMLNQVPPMLGTTVLNNAKPSAVSDTADSVVPLF